MFEEAYHIEPPEVTCIRHNTDAICHLAVAYSSATDKEHCNMLLNMMDMHSRFLLETSHRILKRQKFYIEEVIN